MINPFIFSPRTLKTTAAARYILDLYRNESESFVGISAQLNNDLSAVRNVLVQAYPDLATDLDLLIEKARYVGHAEGHAQDMATLARDFESALPWGIKKEMTQ